MKKDEAKKLIKWNEEKEEDQRDAVIINPTFLEGPVMVHGTRARDDVEESRNKRRNWNQANDLKQFNGRTSDGEIADN